MIPADVADTRTFEKLARVKFQHASAKRNTNGSDIPGCLDIQGGAVKRSFDDTILRIAAAVMLRQRFVYRLGRISWFGLYLLTKTCGIDCDSIFEAKTLLQFFKSLSDSCYCQFHPATLLYWNYIAQ